MVVVSGLLDKSEDRHRSTVAGPPPVVAVDDDDLGDESRLDVGSGISL